MREMRQLNEVWCVEVIVIDKNVLVEENDIIISPSNHLLCAEAFPMTNHNIFS